LNNQRWLAKKKTMILRMDLVKHQKTSLQIAPLVQ
jgi:hypothetical protein